MNDTQGTYLTKEGLQKLQEELAELKNVKRREIAERIQQAKELGDLSENAEYVEAKNEQGFIEGRILELENIIRTVIVINEKKKGREAIEIGTTFEVEAEGTKYTFSIVGSNEIDPANGRISNASPLGKAFLGLREGETVAFASSKGIVTYKILSIH